MKMQVLLHPTLHSTARLDYDNLQAANHQWSRKKIYLWACSILFLSFGFASSGVCNMDQTKFDDSICTVQEIPEWEPGLPRTVRKVLLLSNGTGQEVQIRDDRIIKLNTFKHRAVGSALFAFDPFFDLKDRYFPEEKVKGLIIEGNPPMTNFFFLKDNKIKHIDCHFQTIPEKLAVLKKQIDDYSRQSQVDHRVGTYIVAQPLSPQESSGVLRVTTPRALASKTLDLLPSLNTALAKPTLLVLVPSSELESIKRELSLKELFDESGIFLKATWGVAKIKFYMMD